jgi:exosome complex exonuclease DIS3/RRP44
MLLANIAVAEKIYERFPSISILRRHIQPKVSDLTTLKQIMGSYGYKFSFESSKQLADSLNSISRQGD